MNLHARRGVVPARTGAASARWLPCVLVVVLALGPARPAAANCGAESCPLALHGHEPTDRRVSFELGFQNVHQDQLWRGTNRVGDAALRAEGEDVELLTHTRAWIGTVRARVTPRLFLIGSLPYLDRVHRHDHGHAPYDHELQAWTLRGLGDASLTAHWQALGSTSAPWGALALMAGAKVPTGRRSAEEVDGHGLEPSARLGTGSTDAIAGVQWERRFPVRAPGNPDARMPVALNVSGRMNGKGTEDYRLGDELLASLATAFPLHAAVEGLMQLNAAFHGRDDVGHSHAEPHGTGASALFASPGVRVRLGGGASVYGYWQVRAWANTNGTQLVAPSHLVIGTTVGSGR